ncbi:acyl-CoA/acyl-ACP dehydrogenase [Pseudomonas sp. GD03860]|uniref:acyl-CoA dehydrogenase family protein n=1 Tax=Pseudomonas TaxID=286 RepID=UPI0023638F33|nr:MULTISPECIES: acyl-CoA dehydrogenase family protein [Pseudomonas]MDD2058501.1 acyl-CoA/acyl-ACP dehydrogenase [Pseudomonas putida]MDH0640683.1 acyl-CoA/acyl-ACP dehydrogenase [Pseudomonas sp. GD03860]
MKIPQLTDIQQLSIDSMRTFVQQEVAPNAASMRFGPASREHLLEFTQAVADFGLPGLAVPKAFGGSGMDWVTQARLFEELVKGSPELASVVLVNMLAVELLMSQPALRSQYLPDLLAGRSIAGLGPALVDGKPGNALQARRVGEGFMVDGNIEEVASGMWANFLISSVSLDDQSSCFLLLDRRRDRYETRGIRLESNAARVQLTDTPVGADYCLGDAGPNALLSRRLQVFLRLHEGIARVAQGQAILDATLAAASLPPVHEGPAAGEQLLTLHLAEMITQIESARLMCHHGLMLAQGGGDCEAQASMALFFAQGAVARVERHADWVDDSQSVRRPVFTLQLGPLSCAPSKDQARHIVSRRVN